MDADDAGPVCLANIGEAYVQQCLAADMINKINELTAANVNECHFLFLPIHNIPLRASRIYLEVPKVVIRVPVNQIYH